MNDPKLREYQTLRSFAAMHRDAQETRMAASNRVFQESDLDKPIYADVMAALRASEHTLLLATRGAFRRAVSPGVRVWQQSLPGIGEDSLARLLGHIGHPRIATPQRWEGRVLVNDPPYERTVAQLWSYCGYGDSARRLRKGMTRADLCALGIPQAKVAVHLLATNCVKQVGSETTAGMAVPNPRSPYRDVYEDARNRYAERTHAVECKRCGPSGKPALVGSPWSLAHQHAAALRLVGKELLRDLWVAAA